jgi:hypothetical protein
MAASGATGATGPRIRDRIDQLDAARFVGRTDVVDPIVRLLKVGDEGDVILVHGPGGIGKSALLRELSRQAKSFGRPVYALDGRLILTSLDGVRAALIGVVDDEQPVVLIDSFERMAALAPALRDEILPSLPAAAVVVIAGRQIPDGMWFRDGWEHIARDVKLRPLLDDEASQLLGHLGVTGDNALQTRQWAKGSPLALNVGGAAVNDTVLVGQGLEETIVYRMMGNDLHEVDTELVAVVAIARSVDRPLLAAVLREGDPKVAYEELRNLAVAEPFGNRVTVHELVRTALRADLRSRDEASYRELVCRIADHLCERVLGGEPELVAEVADLIESDAVQWGVSGRFRTDRPGPDDAEEVAAALGPERSGGWAETRRFFDEAPECVMVAREVGGRLAGFTIATTPNKAPAWTAEDPVLGPWLAHARANVTDGNAIIWRDAVNLMQLDDGTPDPGVIALLNVPAHLTQQLPVAAAFYGVVDSEDVALAATSQGLGAVHVPELDISYGGRVRQCHVLTYGPRGLVGQLQGLVHMEQSVPLDLSDTLGVSEVDVRRALRDFHDPAGLAANPLGRVFGVGQRADRLRDMLERSVREGFGESASERGLRHLVERTYIDPSGGHQLAMMEANLSRTSYYRRLAQAVHRVTITVGQQLAS